MIYILKFLINIACTSITYQPNMEVEQHVNHYVHLYDLQMYVVPPSGYIKLEELYQWCIDRCKVLKLVEKVSKQNYKKSFKQCRAALIIELEKNDLINFAKLINASNYGSPESIKQLLRKNDCISHFMLRSAFSLEYEKRQWFYKQEVNLFKWKLSFLDKEDIKVFNYINGFQFPFISKEERQNLKKDLKAFCSDIIYIDSMNFYKIYFTNVINLVAKRQIFLKNGIAYVQETKLFWITLSEFKKRLSKGFTYSRAMISNVYGDERITKLLCTLQNCISKSHFKVDRYKRVSINQLDNLSQKSYPLCMRLLHEALRKNHHLTNGGRVQYCLFLKGIGLTLNDALQFWKDEFIKKISENDFEKEYTYRIRYLYGQEGKRSNYKPFHCTKIFKSTVGLRDNHGCPFKCMTFSLLKETLSKCRLVQSDINSILQLLKQRSYLKACKKYYEITHNCITDKTFDHPNVYFSYSRKYLEDLYSDIED